MAIIENTYLLVNSLVYKSLPIKVTLDEDGNEYSYTLSDIFSKAIRFPLSDKFIIAIDPMSDIDISYIENRALYLGYSVGYDSLSNTDISILSLADIHAIKSELDLYESTHYLNENGIIQEIIQNTIL